MARGDAGPMGAATLVIVLVAQIAALAGLFAPASDPWRLAASVGLVVMASRGSLALACHRAVPSAKGDGLGALVAGSVSTLGAALSVCLLGLCTVGAAMITGRPWWLGVIAVATLLVVLAGWLRHCTRRLGGITGDVLGSCVEIAYLTILAVLAIPA